MSDEAMRGYREGAMPVGRSGYEEAKRKADRFPSVQATAARLMASAMILAAREIADAIRETRHIRETRR